MIMHKETKDEGRRTKLNAPSSFVLRLPSSLFRPLSSEQEAG
jgi:hypothetical protein